jgi:hypothetical protein
MSPDIHIDIGNHELIDDEKDVVQCLDAKKYPAPEQEGIFPASIRPEK